MTTPSAEDKATPLAGGFPAADDPTWRALVDKALKGADFRKRLVSRTADGIEIEPLYTRSPNEPEERPGVAPFTRGTVTRLAAGGWRIAQIRPETTPPALNAAIADDIAGGADAVTIQLAATGQSGLPPDLKSLEAAIGSLPLGTTRVSLAAGALGLTAAAALIELANRPGASSSISATNIASLGIDPLGHLARTGEWSLLKPGGKGFTTALPWLAPPATTLLADSRPYHEAGASEAQEIAALLSTLVAYLRACETDAMPPARALPCIALAMATDADLFVGIAKLRAARRLVARVAQACGAEEAAGRMQLVVSTSQRMMARRDPWVNMLRVTVAATAAAIGGADEIAVLPYTWALGQPDAQAARIARNVGLVLREEAGLGRVVDAAGGAWALEALTDELSAKAWSIFQNWEGAGGMLAVLTSGRIHDEIGTIAQTRTQDIATRRIELTGVSAYPQLGVDGLKVVPWPKPLAPTPSSNVRPLVRVRLAAPFEALRDNADKAAPPPKVFLASLGTNAEHGARTMWITNLLATGGIAVVTSGDLTSSPQAGHAFAASGATAACICGSDETYGQLADATAMALKGAGATHVWLAGRPNAEKAQLEAAGVDGFLHAGIDVVDALRAVHRSLGISA